MTDLLYQWIDLIWIPISIFIVHKHQRIKTVFFVLSCILTLRLQVELMEEIDKATGFFKIMDSYVFHRGLVLYGIVIALFLILAHFSPKTKPAVFLAAAISIYILSFAMSMLLMIL